MAELTDQLIATEEADAWTGFVLREVAEPGPAFAVLYDNVWAPGMELMSQLIGLVRRDADREACRLEALLLISSLTAFGIARPVALKFLAWPDAAGARYDQVMAAIFDRIERLA